MTRSGSVASTAGGGSAAGPVGPVGESPARARDDTCAVNIHTTTTDMG